MDIIIQQEKEINKTKAEKIQQYLKDKNMAWCFDEQGFLWAREDLTIIPLSTKRRKK